MEDKETLGMKDKKTLEESSRDGSYDMRAIAAKAVRDALDDLNIALSNAASCGLHVSIDREDMIHHGAPCVQLVLILREIAAIQKF